MQLKLQSGDAWWARNLGRRTPANCLARTGIKRDDRAVALLSRSGIAADRETLRVVKGAPHPIAARILIELVRDDEFQNVGWYKETPDAEAVNHWNITEADYLVAYAGGVMPANRVVPAGLGETVLSRRPRQPDPADQLGMVYAAQSSGFRKPTTESSRASELRASMGVRMSQSTGGIQ